MPPSAAARWLRSVFRPRRLTPDERGSLPMAMLLTVVISGMGALMLSNLLRTVSFTRTDGNSVSALAAGRAGLASALTRLRAAVDPQTQFGSPSLLPCGVNGAPQMSGTLDSGARYTIKILYLSQDPRNQSDTWLAANGQQCTAAVPKYGYLSSTGIATDGTQRTLFATYVFKTLLKGNTPGGQIHVQNSTLCMDSGPALVAGAEMTMQPCATDANGDPIDRQRFSYEPNVTIRLTKADPVMYPNGLCLDAGWPEVAKAVVLLQACGNPTLPRQQWSFNTSSDFAGTDDGKGLNDKCLSMEKINTAGSRLLLNTNGNALGGTGRSGCKTVGTNYQSWNPDAAVGAGGAGLAVTKQVVNYSQFGKCLDDQTSTMTVVVFACKQTPDPTIRDANQQWTMPAGGTGQVTVIGVNDGKLYCMTTTGPAVAAGTVVGVATCQAGNDAQIWKIRGRGTQSYDEAYRIEGSGAYDGYCLQPLADASHWGSGLVNRAYKAGIKPCSDDLLQKWNALPASTTSDFSGFGER